MMRRNPIGGLFSTGIFASASSPPEDSHQDQDEDSVEEDEETQSEPQFSGWNFGGFIKTLAEKSGGVLQAYQHDLQEFGIGLKKETEVITGVTAHVVKDLPLSLETGATVAQESLETVGQTLEEFGSSVWRGTTEIFAQVKEAVLKVDEDAAGTSNLDSLPSSGDLSASLSQTKYSRYETQVNAMQRDSSTYCDEPEDENDFASWVATFNMDDRKEEIDEILSTNAFMQELQNRIVPVVVELDTFWSRYFYRLNKLQQIENARVNLVKRATDGEEEEDLSWDVDEEKDIEEPTPPSEMIVEEIKADEATPSPQSMEVLVVSVEADTHEEEESKSEGSAGSEWLVVSEDKGSGTSEPKSSQPSSPISEIKETEKTEASAPVKAEEHEVNEAELDEIGDLSIDDDIHEPVKPKGKVDKGATLKGLATAAGEETEEDWGEWE